MPAGVSSASARPMPAPAPIDVALTAFKVVKGRHGEQFVDAASARPGDVLEYRAVYRNHSQAPLRAVVGSLPVPKGTRYVLGSARPANAIGHTADGRDEALPVAMRTAPAIPAAASLADAASAGGQTDSQATADYRSLRWTLGDMAGGATRSISARVRIDTASAAGPASGPPPHRPPSAAH
ncbi:MAG: hypothetical protein ACRYG5_01935 [Janthinobacterium lividum]